MAAFISTSSFSNPYSDFLSIRRENGALGPMKRFKKDVRLPLPNQTGSADPFQPMKRFSRDVTPPHYTPIYPSDRGHISSTISIDLFAADRAYRAASSFTLSGSTVNSLR